MIRRKGGANSNHNRNSDDMVRELNSL